MALAGVLFMVAAFWGNAGVWVPIGVVFLILASVNFRRRRPVSRGSASASRMSVA